MVDECACKGETRAASGPVDDRATSVLSSAGRVATELLLLVVLVDRDRRSPVVVTSGFGEQLAPVSRSKLSSAELMDVLLKLGLSIESMLLIDEQQLSSMMPPDINRFTSRSGLSMLVDESTESCSVVLLLLLLLCDVDKWRPLGG